MTLFDCWQRTVARVPERVLVTDAASGRRWTVAEVHARMEVLEKEELQAADWRGRVVLIPQANSLQWILHFLVCIKRGGVPLPVDPDTPDRVLAEWMVAFHAVALMKADGVQVLDPAQVEGGEMDSVALLKLVPGLDGEVQRVAFTTPELLADLEQVTAGMRLGEDDVNYALMPFGHSYGFTNLVLPLVVHGIPLVLASDIFPSGIARDLLVWRPQVLPLVPTLVRALNRSTVPLEGFSTLRLVISAGDTLLAGDAQVFLQKFGVALHQFYGASETGGICFDESGEATLEGRSVGSPLPGVSVEVCESGFLRVKSAAVAGGEAVTADFGEVLASGEVCLRGRRPELLKLSGRRINPLEVERVLWRVAGTEVAQVKPYLDRFGELRTELSYCGPMSKAELRQVLCEYLSGWKVPHRIRLLNESNSLL